MTNQCVKPELMTLVGMDGALYLSEPYELSSFDSKYKSVFISQIGLV